MNSNTHPDSQVQESLKFVKEFYDFIYSVALENENLLKENLTAKYNTVVNCLHTQPNFKLLSTYLPILKEKLPILVYGRSFNTVYNTFDTIDYHLAYLHEGKIICKDSNIKNILIS